MQQKALSIYEDLVALGNLHAGAAAPPPFNTNKGWLERFKDQNNLLSITKSGEAASADKEAVQDRLLVFKKIIMDGGYIAEQVFSDDETRPYWKRMPNRTVIFKEEKKAPGHKASKDSVTAGWW